MTKTAELHTTMRQALGKAIVGQESVLEGLFLALMVGGHVLLEGVPGTAKTLMARTLAATMDAQFRRVQFTPDLLPSDIIGTNVYRADSGNFEFRSGPIFTDLLLADEINRAPAKTQSALLEAMEERQVTSDGVRHSLSDRFLVVATQNPVEMNGTYPLPEAQLDRFFLKLDVGTPSPSDEAALLRRVHEGFDPRHLDAAGVDVVANAKTVMEAQVEVQSTTVSDPIISYITAICSTTRVSPDLLLGASPRGAISLLQGSKALARLRGRDYVVPDDVKDLTIPTLRHRMIRRPEAEIQGVSEVAAVQRAVGRVPVPR